MKKIFYIIAAFATMASMSSCDWFELDNTEGYNAKIHGAFLDSGTNKPVPSEIYGVNQTFTWGSFSWTVTGQQAGMFGVVEKNWDTESVQNWNIKNDGTYVNNLVFAGDYVLSSKDANYYPVDNYPFKIEKGDNEVNFTVTPYCRVLDTKISYDASSKRIIAKFKVNFGDTSKNNKLGEVRLCCFTDRFVGSNFNNCKNDPSASLANNWMTDLTAMADGNTEITLSIDTANAANDAEFHYKRDHYVRVGAYSTVVQSSVTPWGTFDSDVMNTNHRYNFGPVFKISADFSTITEVTEW